MPAIGVQGPWLAEYNSVNGVVSYKNGFKLARMVSFAADPDDSGESNDFYSDNGLSETERGSSSGSGTITETIDHFDQEGSKRILGLEERPIMIDGEEELELVYNDDTRPGYFGHGIVVKHRKSGKDLWLGLVLTKTMYSIPGDAAETQGESINWQAKELSATYMKDDSEKKDWKRQAWFDSEKKAIRYVETVLNIMPLGELAIVSSAGTDVGHIAIKVTPALTSGNAYKYITAAAVGLPAYGQVIGKEYSDWDGTEDIAATKDHEILVVEVDKEGKAQKAGIAKIVVNE